ncbi:MAG: zinc ribbon domain-containing protein [Oscillospiraceae bacterium]|nr:zinc ribbon domain-containing protein [Oscillospiraceae bacterium]
METKAKTSASQKKKGGGFKTFLSVVFFILILLSAFVLSLCMSIRTKSSEIINVYSKIAGSGITDFLAGDICFWCAISAVILWFGLWVQTTRRVPSAIRGLGIACSIAPASVLAGELVVMLLVCAFKVQNSLTPYADSLPSQFVNSCGDNVIFLLSSMIIASVGILICKIIKLLKAKKADKAETSSFEANAEPAAEPVSDPVLEPVAASVPVQDNLQANTSENESIRNIDIDVSDNNNSSSTETSDDAEKSIIKSLEGVCHLCGAKNEPGVKFCGSCGAKLI